MIKRRYIELGLGAMEDLRTKELESAINIIEWGRWARAAGLPTGNPNEHGTPNISDDEALRIDQQVAKLPGRPQTVIKMIYVRDYGINELASKLKISNRMVMAYRDQGLNILYGALYGSLDMVH